MKFMSGLILLFAHLHVAKAQSLDESAIQACACKGMELEVATAVRTRVDCLSETHAIEVEALQDWPEAIGQSLHYAEQTGKIPKVLFFCEQDGRTCNRHWFTFQSTISHFKLPIEAEYVPEHCVLYQEPYDRRGE